jgi:predicted  nucleic acid-binding Zn-ribbon protein
MKVAELKQVVDANAVEMREEFGKVRDEFGKVREEFGKVREEMRTESGKLRAEIAALREEMHQSAQETRRHIDVFFEDAVHKAYTVLEAQVDEHIDLRVAKAEVRLERKFDRKYGKH